MNLFTLKDITVELSTESDKFIGSVEQLVLELKLDDQILDEARLLSRESSPGIWDASRALTVSSVEKDVILSVFLEAGEEERQLISYTTLNGPELYDRVGEQSEIQLAGNQSMVLKMDVIRVIEGNTYNSFSSDARPKHGEKEEYELEDELSKATDQIRDFERYGNIQTLEQAIDTLQRASVMTSKDHPDHLSILNNLGAALFNRFHHLRNVEDVNKAVSHQQAIIELTPDGHPDKPDRLRNLGNSLQARFQHTGDIADVDKAIGHHQAAVDLTVYGHPGKPSHLNSLGNSLLARFERLGNLSDLDNAITYQQEAVNLTSDGHPDKLIRLNNLGNSLRVRFRRLGRLDDIDDSILKLQESVKLTPDDDPRRYTALNNLGSSFSLRFQRFGNIGDINNAILQLNKAVSIVPDAHIDKSNLLNNLGSALRSRFERIGNIDDINDAITQQQAAVDMTPDSRSVKPLLLSNLGGSFQTRFQRLGNLGDIDNAIAHLRSAAIMTPNGHPEKGGRLNNLGNSLRIRFERFGNPEDINNAVSRLQDAANSMPDGHYHKPIVLAGLGNSLRARFERFGSITDINGAIENQQKAVKLTPNDHSDRPDRLDNLGSSLLARFRRLENPADINNAILQQKEAVKLTPDNHPEKSRRLTNLGSSLAFRFGQLGELGDVDDAIEQYQAAADFLPDDHPDKVVILGNLGMTILSRFTESEDIHDAEAAIAQLSAAAKSSFGPPTRRFNAAVSWIRGASMIEHPSLLAAYECALDIIPLVAWLGLSIKDRHQHLLRMGGIAREAAATAISLQRYDKAIEWLEQGRSIVWTQILQLRTPIDQLRNVDSELAKELLQTSRMLDGGAQQTGSQVGNKVSTEEDGRRYRALAEKWEALVQKVRSLPNFQDFLRPPRLSQLMGAAKNGPVVVLNIAEERCDALALIDGADMPVHIPLPNFTLEKATDLQADLKVLLTASGLRLRAIREPQFEGGGDEECKRILGELWNCLVKPVLDSLSFARHPDKLPHIWWCVTGPLAFLPIHAAGIYNEGSIDGQIYDYVISSYTPTLTALLESPKSTTDTRFKMLSVAEPSTGRWYIPNTVIELEHIQRHLHDRDHHVLVGPDTTKERVIEAMKNCHWLHLACHGSQNVRNPTQSALKLRGDDLPLEEIIKLDLPGAEFAFLSACQTVTGDEKLSEESVHIAGGMLLAGYRSVVATMWSIEDKLAPEVADEFYRHLIVDGVRPDSRKTAEALHLSVQKLRRTSKIRMVSWIPFVHLGI